MSAPAAAASPQTYKDHTAGSAVYRIAKADLVAAAGSGDVLFEMFDMQDGPGNDARKFTLVWPDVFYAWVNLEYSDLTNAICLYYTFENEEPFLFIAAGEHGVLALRGLLRVVGTLVRQFPAEEPLHA